MRHLCCLTLSLDVSVAAFAADWPTGKVIKVLPQLMEPQGRHTRSPSLYDRDAYQAELRKDMTKVSGIRFDVKWQARGAAKQTAVLRVEVRGPAKGNLPGELRLETTVDMGRWSHWAVLKLDGEQYKSFGEITAWRATLWAGDELLSEQKSFLW